VPEKKILNRFQNWIIEADSEWWSHVSGDAIKTLMPLYLKLKQ
jgi:hypothetical protein